MLDDSDYYMIFGGVTENRAEAAVNKVFQWHYPVNAWYERAPMATARYCPACGLVSGNRVVVAGGSNRHASSEIYDVASNTWTAGTRIRARMWSWIIMAADNYFKQSSLARIFWVYFHFPCT